jgi:hypothetical protein
MRNDDDAPLRSPGRGMYGTISPRSQLTLARSEAASKGWGAPLGGEALDGLHSSSSWASTAPEAELNPLLRGAIRQERAKNTLCGDLTCSPRTRACLTIVSAFLLGLIIIMIVVGFKVIAPAYVQGRIKDTKLEISQLEIIAGGSLSLGAPSTAAAPGGLFTLKISASLSGLSPVGGTLNPFSASLVYAGSTVGTFTMPAIAAAANAVNPVDVTAQVTSFEPAFKAFATAVLLQDSVTATLSGTVSVTTTVAGSAITVSGVEFSKDVTLVGCSGLRGGVVTSFSLANSTATTVIADLTVALSNPSVVGISPLGDFGVDIVYQGVALGTAVARGAVLAAGPMGLTSLSLRGELTSRPSNAAALNTLVDGYLSNSSTMLSAVPRPCYAIENCTGSIPLFAPLLSSGALLLNATLPPSPKPLITGVSILGMFLEPQGPRTVGLALQAQVEVDALLGAHSPLLVTSLGIVCTLEGDTSDSTVAALGDLLVPPTAVNAPAAYIREGTLGILVNVSAQLDITESDDAFSTFVVHFISTRSVRLRLSPRTLGASGVSVGLYSSALGGFLNVTVPLSVTTVVAGIGGFPGVQVQAFNVLNADASPPGTVGVSIDVELFNPSPATFPLGQNASFQVVYRGDALGKVEIYNTTLVPGNNTLHAVGFLAPGPSSLPSASALFSAYLSGSLVTANVTGLGVSLGPATDTPSWLTKAVQSLTLSAALPGLDPALARNLLANASLPRLTLDLWDASLGKFYAAPLASGRVCALLQLPFVLPVSALASVNVSVGFSYQGAPSAGPVAVLNASYQVSEWFPCSSSAQCAPFLTACSGGAPTAAVAVAGGQHGGGLAAAASQTLTPAGVLLLNLERSPLILTDGGAGLSGLVARVLREREVAVRLVGSASPSIVGLPFGSVALSGLPLDTTVVLVGMANLTSPPASVTNGQIYDTFEGGLNVTVDLNFTNPSSLSGSLGPVVFGIGTGMDSPSWDFKGGLPAILVSLDNLNVGPGQQRFTVPSTFFVPPQATSPFAFASVRSLLGRFLSQLSTNVSLVGLGSWNNNAGVVTSRSPILQPAIETLRAACAFPGIPSPLLTNATLIPDLSTLLTGLKANATLRLTNVLNVSLKIEQASLTLFMCGSEKVTDGGVVCESNYYTDPIGFFYRGDLMQDYGGVLAPPLSSKDTVPYPVSFLATGDDVLKVLVQALDKDIVTKANGTVDVSLVGPSRKGILINVELEQLDLPVCLFDSKDCDVRRPQG